MAVRLAVRLDRSVRDSLDDICVTYGVSRTALVQALLEVTVEKFLALGDDPPAGPAIVRAREIDAARRSR